MGEKLGNLFNKLFTWMRDYNTEVTWFIIGMLFNSMVNHLARGLYEMAILDLVIAWINYYFWKTR